MTRQSRSRGDSSIRAAIVAKHRQLVEAFPTPGAIAALAAAEDGEPLVLSTDILCGALAFAGHPRAAAFTLAADRGACAVGYSARMMC